MDKIKYKDIRARYTYQGGIICSAYVCDEYAQHQYFYYTLRQAKCLFLKECKKMEAYGSRWIHVNQFRGY